MSKIIGIITFFSVILATGQVFPGEGEKGRGPKSPNPQNPEIVVAGKLFCSLKRQVVIPYHSIIASLRVRSGKRVKAGEVLARYRLEPEVVLKLRRRVSSLRIRDLEMRLADIEKDLAKLGDKRKEITLLAQKDMAPGRSLDQINREIELLNKKRTLLQERIPHEKILFEEELAFLRKQLGNSVRPDHVAKNGTLVAPIGGHVIWVHPDLRQDAELNPGARVFWVGVMDPMLIRAWVHEIETVQLKVGDVAEFSTESITGRKFEAKVSNISWATMTPQLEQPSYYEIELEVPNPQLILREGLKVRIVFHKKK